VSLDFTDGVANRAAGALKFGAEAVQILDDLILVRAERVWVEGVGGLHRVRESEGFVKAVDVDAEELFEDLSDELIVFERLVLRPPERYVPVDASLAASVGTPC
jgi:hypothetical protein